jgi:hypothetical protein
VVPPQVVGPSKVALAVVPVTVVSVASRGTTIGAVRASLMTEQREVLQLALAAHALPQAPQLARSAVSVVHVAPQAVCPVGQVQRPVVHVWPVAQRVPQAPQLVASVWVLTQAPPHSVVPVGHTQRPVLHVCPVAHAPPQRPQLALSVWRLTQVVPQAV